VINTAEGQMLQFKGKTIPLYLPNHHNAAGSVVQFCQLSFRKTKISGDIPARSEKMLFEK
jgi:hypothetical protein